MDAYGIPETSMDYVQTAAGLFILGMLFSFVVLAADKKVYFPKLNRKEWWFM